MVQDSCDLLAQQVDQKITLSKLARIIGTNKRFAASFNCAP